MPKQPDLSSCSEQAQQAFAGLLRMTNVTNIRTTTVMEPVTALWDHPAMPKQKDGLSPGLFTIQTLHSLRRRIELLSILVARSSASSDLRHDLRDLAYL
jgi:hypothetical protein